MPPNAYVCVGLPYQSEVLIIAQTRNQMEGIKDAICNAIGHTGCSYDSSPLYNENRVKGYLVHFVGDLGKLENEMDLAFGDGLVAKVRILLEFSGRNGIRIGKALDVCRQIELT